MAVGVRKTASLETRRHRLRRKRGVAGRGHGVDLDKLLVDVKGELLLRVQPFGGRWPRHHGEERDQGGDESDPKKLPRGEGATPGFSTHPPLPKKPPDDFTQGTR